MKKADNLSQDDALLQQLFETVLQNLENEQFSVEELSEQVGMSRSHLHRKLKLLKGQSVSQFIREVRLEEAMKLLQNDVATAAEIAYRVGFHSTSYFHKCFHDHFGYSPMETKQIFKDKNQRGTLQDAEVLQPVENEKADSLSEPPSPRTIKHGIMHDPTQNQITNLYKIVAASVLLLIMGFSVFYFLTKNKMPSPGEKSIAVLPFDNLSTEETNRYFADGIVEDLLNRLSMIEEFKVISRTSSEMYREKGSKSVPQIARELDVVYIIEGTVQREAGKARITVQLIDARQDAHLWSKVFDRDINDIFKIQSEIAIQIASELNTVMTTQQTTDLQKNYTENIKAFERYQLGRFHWDKRTYVGVMKSIGYFEQAIAEDPEYALAYSGLADTYNILALQHMPELKQVHRNKAYQLATQALSLDESLAEAHTALAGVYIFIDWNWGAGQKECLRAIELSPNHSTAHQYYAEYLSIMGNYKEARKHINQALEIDPNSFIIRFLSASYYSDQGQYELAFAEHKRCIELNKDQPWLPYEGFVIHRGLGHDRLALADFKKWTRGDRHFEPSEVDSVFEISGLDGLLQWRIDSIEWIMGRAVWHVWLGDDKKALDILELAFQEGVFHPGIATSASFKHLRAQPRYKALMHRMGLPPFEPTSNEN